MRRRPDLGAQGNGTETRRPWEHKAQAVPEARGHGMEAQGRGSVLPAPSVSLRRPPGQPRRTRRLPTAAGLKRCHPPTSTWMDASLYRRAPAPPSLGRRAHTTRLFSSRRGARWGLGRRFPGFGRALPAARARSTACPVARPQGKGGVPSPRRQWKRKAKAVAHLCLGALLRPNGVELPVRQVGQQLRLHGKALSYAVKAGGNTRQRH